MHLLKSYVERAIDLPTISLVDLGFGDEGYKKRFANSQQQITQLVATNSWGQYLRLLVRNIILKNVKRSQTLELWMRSCAGLVMSASERFRKEGTLASIRKGLRKIRTFMYARDAIAFFQWRNIALGNEDKKALDEVRLQSLDWHLLSRAALYHESDADTISYLVRAGERLLKGEAQGFAVMAEDGIPVHFCWVSDFDGFCSKRWGVL